MSFIIHYRSIRASGASLIRKQTLSCHKLVYKYQILSQLRVSLLGVAYVLQDSSVDRLHIGSRREKMCLVSLLLSPPLLKWCKTVMSDISKAGWRNNIAFFFYYFIWREHLFPLTSTENSSLNESTMSDKVDLFTVLLMPVTSVFLECLLKCY